MMKGFFEASHRLPAWLHITSDPESDADGSPPVQACYGHTEGAAGLTGLLTAMQQVSDYQVPGIMCLKNINPYVTAALADWSKSSGSCPLASRQSLPASCCSHSALAGISAVDCQSTSS